MQCAENLLPLHTESGSPRFSAVLRKGAATRQKPLNEMSAHTPKHSRGADTDSASGHKEDAAARTLAAREAVSPETATAPADGISAAARHVSADTAGTDAAADGTDAAAGDPKSPGGAGGGRLRRGLKVAAWIMATPVLLFLLCAALLYLPPVQRWAVGVACERLSASTGLDVRVADVRLRFPLDLAMHGMSAVDAETGDTLVAAGTLATGIRLLPLLKGRVEADEILLEQARVDTRDWIDALSVTGRIGRLALSGNEVSLGESLIRVGRLELDDAALHLSLSDSVPPDTAPSEPTPWRVELPEIALRGVRFGLLLSPQSDSMRVAMDVGEGDLCGSLDLGNGVYDFTDVAMRQSDIAVDLAAGGAAEGFDAQHIRLSEADIRIPHVRYDGDGNLNVDIRRLEATERSGLALHRDTRLVVSMDSVSLAVDSLHLVSQAGTRMDGFFYMDLTAFADTLPGQFDTELTGTVARRDLAAFVPDYRKEMESLSPLPMQVEARVRGNLQKLDMERVYVNLPGQLTLNAEGQARDQFGQMTTSVRLDAPDASFVRGFLPADVRNSFLIPRDLQLQADVQVGEHIAADGTLLTPAGSALFSVDYQQAGDTYDADLAAEAFSVNQFVDLAEPVSLTGHVKASGSGFDFLKRTARADATVDLQAARYGKFNLSQTQANLQLRDGQLQCSLCADNPQLSTVAQLSGAVQPSPLRLHADLDLAHADLFSMGLYADEFVASGHGSVDFLYDFERELNLRADIDGLRIRMDGDTLQAERFDLSAATAADTTYALLRTGDLDFDLRTGENLFDMLSHSQRLASAAQKQWENRAIDIDALKAYLPNATLRMHAGRQNPVSRFLAIQQIAYGHVDADLRTTPEYGLLGSAMATGLQAAGVQLDTVSMLLRQDSDRVTYRTLVDAPDQTSFKAFTASLDGYVSPTEGDARLLFQNQRRETGIDLGLHAQVGDSALECALYPEEPVLGYKRFSLNRTNYLRLTRKNRLQANVLLKGVGDHSLIAIQANPADTLLQDIHALVKDLDLADILNVVPGMPEMTGRFNLDANYRQTAQRFWVSGETHLDDFVYEGTQVGNVQGDFDYMPQPDGLQRVKMTVGYEGREVATVDGQYNPAEQGHIDTDIRLDSVPLALTAPFIPNQTIVLGGTMSGRVHVGGGTDDLSIDGELLPSQVTVGMPQYSVSLRMADDPITITDGLINFDRLQLYGSTDQNLTLNGWIDLSDLAAMRMNLSLYGRDFKLVDAPRSAKAVIFGDVWGDVFARVSGTMSDLRVRGLVKVLKNSNVTYVMEDTPLSVDDRLSDIVTFVDFTAPPDTTVQLDRSLTGMDLNLSLIVESGAKLNCEFSADKQSYVNVQGDGNIAINMTPEGVFTMTGRYTVSEGEMKYTLPVIPLKTFTIAQGSYVEFTGDPMNPTLDFTATEETHATVTDASGSSRSVLFNTGLQVTGTLEEMQLLFTIEAPEDLSVKNELSALPKEDKNKLAVGLLCTGMYMSSTNTSGVSANNALNNFLQNEINNIAGKALATAVDVDMGLQQSTRDDGTTRTDYSFKFSKRFFSDRLNVVVGGRVNTDGNRQENEAGAYIDDISLEWRLNSGGTRYVRLYHEKNYDNLIEGELTVNGASLVLRRKLDKLSELMIWKKDD